MNIRFWMWLFNGVLMCVILFRIVWFWLLFMKFRMLVVYCMLLMFDDFRFWLLVNWCFMILLSLLSVFGGILLRVVMCSSIFIWVWFGSSFSVLVVWLVFRCVIMMVMICGCLLCIRLVIVCGFIYFSVFRLVVLWLSRMWLIRLLVFLLFSVCISMLWM